MLVGTSLYKRIDGKQVLRNVSVEIAPGRVTMVLGPNGSSKSVLLRALLMSDPPSQGTVTVDDVPYDFSNNLGDHTPRPWPKVVAVFQQLFLLPHLRIIDQVLLPFTLETSFADAKQTMLELANLLDVGEVLRRYPNQMSVGQRQRCAIIRALVLKPKYLLLDEVTSALDVESTLKVMSLVAQLRKDGTGVLFVTHLMGVAKRLADSVIFMHDGEVAEYGSVDILSHPKTSKLREFMALMELPSVV